MNNTSKNIIRIDAGITRAAAIWKIKNAFKEKQWVLLIDLMEVTFPLHRDFFLVLSRKFPSDQYVLRLKNEKTAELARSLGIQIESSGFQAEFEKKYKNPNLVTHNMSMWDYFVYELKRGGLYLKYLFFDRKDSEKKLPKFKKRNSNFFLIVGWLIVSITLLLFIFHFAVSKTIIQITPDIIVRPVSANIVYKLDDVSGSVLDTRKTVSLKRITLPVESSMKFKVDTIDPNSAMNARWVITIYNVMNTEQDLRPETRFVTADGIVFRSTGWVKVPWSRSLNGITEIGFTEVEVVADPYDQNGKVIGQRGDIASGTDLVIPGLKFNRDKVYAKAKSDFSGWDEPRVHVLTEDELKRFEWVMNEHIQKVGREEIQKSLDAERQKTGADFALLIGDMISFTGTVSDIISGQKVGDTTDEIELRTKTEVHATVFDRKATIEYLTNIFREGLLRWTDKEIGIHPDTLRVSNVVTRAADDSELKVTVEMNTSVTYDFENVTNELTRRLKTLIAGISQQDAIQRLKDEWHITDVKIKSYPFWLGNVSSNIDNIEFVINNQ